jgi:hypothetical protein
MPPDTTSGAVSADAAGGRATGPLAAPGGTPPVPAAAPSASATWYDGVPTETLGWWQNKGLDLANPKDFALRLTEQYRAAERHIGVPPDQLLRIPQPTASEADKRAFLTRLGVPSTAAEYDLSTVKFTDGTELAPEFATTLRDAFAAGNVAKDKASAIAAAIVRYEEAKETTAAAETAARIAAQRALMERNWGPNKDFNMLQSQVGARRLGITDEQLQALREDPRWGEYATLELFRKIGASSEEHTFVDGAQATGAPTTRPGAEARLKERMADDAWGRRVTAGDTEAVREYLELTQLVAGVNEAMEMGR